MEKDIDEVLKIARSVKGKLESINKDVNHLSLVSARIVILFLTFVLMHFYFSRTWQTDRSLDVRKEQLLTEQG